ncbi:hypothetical protein AAF712_015466 [Marasmius tenuissimus]|uniref:Uncharacterized protein n=1 Tax=Marasmius tenuissimus TaxID=585030 RepID=A0ABR2Z8G2_9AGAR
MPSFRTLVVLVLAALTPLTSAVAVPKQPSPIDLAHGLKLELRSNPTTIGKRAEATHGPRGEGVKLAPFVELCAKLSIDVSVTAFLKVIS